jgi:hypothetical protein
MIDADEDAALRIVESVRAAFPEDASSIDAMFQRVEWEVGEAPTIWLEHFSQLTTDAIRQSDLKRADCHLRFMSELLERADQAATRCIDVAYVESLMWNIDDDSVRGKGWKLIPENLQSLYVAMWGRKAFMEGIA